MAQLTRPPPPELRGGSGRWQRVRAEAARRWVRARRWRHIGARVVLILAVVLTGMMLVLAAGMWQDDRTIEADQVTTTATVLKVSALRTGIEFVDTAGLAQRPATGVLYPGGLEVGQQFLVEYSAADPSRARVAGRTWVNGVVMPVLVIVGTWAVSVPLVIWLRRRARTS